MSTDSPWRPSDTPEPPREPERQPVSNSQPDNKHDPARVCEVCSFPLPSWLHTLCARCRAFCGLDDVDNATMRSLAALRQRAQRDDIGGALDGRDPWVAFVDGIRQMRATPPPVRPWSGMCLWCARELRERSGDAITHCPPLSRIQPCRRHAHALRAFASAQRRVDGERLTNWGA